MFLDLKFFRVFQAGAVLKIRKQAKNTFKFLKQK